MIEDETLATSTEKLLLSIQSYLIVGIITDTASIIQDITDQIEETKEKKLILTSEPSITDNDNDELQVPTTSSLSKTSQKKRAVSSMSVKVAKLQYLAK